MQEEKIKVLYIGGCSRSGSTLVERMLGQVNGYHAVGEVWHIWNRGFAENQLCGCHTPFHECAFWSQVVEEAFGRFHYINIEEIQSLKRSVLSARHIPLLIYPFLQTSAYKDRLEKYTLIIRKLYRAISTVSGSRVIIDSSKFPHYAAMLQKIPEIDMNILHLVRDSRATAYSWRRKRVRPEVHWTVSYMDSHGLLGSTIEWSAMNFLMQPLKRSNGSYMMLRYEDFVNRPKETLQQIMVNMGEDQMDLDFFRGEKHVNLKANHTVSGNPNRFQNGEVYIQPDGEWQQKMSIGQKAVVTALTWPLLINYGYVSNPPMDYTFLYD